MKRRRPEKKPPKKPWIRKYESDPWNRLDVRLELHFCPSLQEKFGLPAVIYEDPKAREESV